MTGDYNQFITDIDYALNLIDYQYNTLLPNNRTNYATYQQLFINAYQGGDYGTALNYASMLFATLYAMIRDTLVNFTDTGKEYYGLQLMFTNWRSTDWKGIIKALIVNDYEARYFTIAVLDKMRMLLSNEEIDPIQFSRPEDYINFYL